MWSVQYAPQVGTTDIEKDDFWNSLGSVMTKILRLEKVWMGADLNGHVGEGNHGAAEVMGRYGVGVRNKKGDRIVDFATANQLAVANTSFKKRTSSVQLTLVQDGTCKWITFCAGGLT